MTGTSLPGCIMTALRCCTIDHMGDPVHYCPHPTATLILIVRGLMLSLLNLIWKLLWQWEHINLVGALNRKDDVSTSTPE